MSKMIHTKIGKMMQRQTLRAIFIVALLSISLSASGQFTIRPSASPEVSTVKDSVVINPTLGTLPSQLNIYNEAYRRYVERETFKYRNKFSMRSSLGITQTSFDNWAAGGTNSFSGRVWANFKHIYTNEETNFKIESVFDGAYTIVVTDEEAKKSEDYFNISSTPSWRIADNLDFSGSIILKSQFTNGYVSPGDTILSSAFFAPATITVSAGLTYSIPKINFKIFVAPLSGNATLVLNRELADQGAYGVKPGFMTKEELGAFTRIEYRQEMFKKSTLYETKIESFWNYRDTPTLWWENRLSYKLNNIFGVSLYVKVLYDENATPPRADQNNFWQVNQSLGFNLTFNIESKSNDGPLTFFY